MWLSSLRPMRVSKQIFEAQICFLLTCKKVKTPRVFNHSSPRSEKFSLFILSWLKERPCLRIADRAEETLWGLIKSLLVLFFASKFYKSHIVLSMCLVMKSCSRQYTGVPSWGQAFQKGQLGSSVVVFHILLNSLSTYSRGDTVLFKCWIWGIKT